MTTMEAAAKLESVRVGWALLNGPTMGAPASPEVDRIRVAFDECYQLAAHALRNHDALVVALERLVSDYGFDTIAAARTALTNARKAP